MNEEQKFTCGSLEEHVLRFCRHAAATATLQCAMLPPLRDMKKGSGGQPATLF